MKKFLIAIIFLFVLFAAFSSFAANYDLEMPLLSGQTTAATPGQYIQMLYMYGLGLAGIVGLFAMVWGGLVYMVSGSSETRKAEGKRWIWGAVSGIILLLFSYLIFFTLGGSQFISLKEPRLNETISNINENGSYQMEMPLAGQQPATPGEYVRTFFIFGLGGVGIVALFAILYGGTLYLLSGGFSATMKTRGKEWIFSALAGLALLLCAYLILATINPQLVNWNSKPPDQVSIGGNNGISSGTTASPYQLEMPLDNQGQQAANPGQYIKTFFIFGLGLVGIVALFGVVFGGLNYILAGSSETRKASGKQWISAAVAGVVLLLCSFLILNTINPQLVSWNLESLKKVSIGGEIQTNLGSSDNPYQMEMPLGASGQAAKTPSDYIRLLFIFGLGLVGVTALFSVVWGGLNYVFAGSSETRKTEGKKWIFGAASGLALLLCSYLILGTINPQLLALQNPKLESIVIEPHVGLGAGTPTVSISSLSASKQEIANLIVSEAKRQGVNPALALAVAQQESGFNQSAISPKGAIGVFQLMPSTASGHGVNPSDLNQNVRGGIAELARLSGRFNGNTEAVLGGYNMGEGGYRSVLSGQRSMPKETQQFIPEVIDRISSFRQQGY